MPLSVLGTFHEAKRLSVHALPPGQDSAETVLIWRKGANSPKVDALVEILQGNHAPANETAATH